MKYQKPVFCENKKNISNCHLLFFCCFFFSCRLAVKTTYKRIKFCTKQNGANVCCGYMEPLNSFFGLLD